MQRNTSFFVYGTLLPHQPNFHYWQNSITAQMPAILENGRLYDLGYYPMLIEEEGHVKGMVIHVEPDSYWDILASLDKLEGYTPNAPASSHYRREIRAVTLADNSRIETWVYIGQPQLVRNCPQIPDGDWQTYSQQKQADIEKTWRDVGKIREDL